MFLKILFSILLTTLAYTRVKTQLLKVIPVDVVNRVPGTYNRQCYPGEKIELTREFCYAVCVEIKKNNKPIKMGDCAPYEITEKPENKKKPYTINAAACGCKWCFAYVQWLKDPKEGDSFNIFYDESEFLSNLKLDSTS